MKIVQFINEISGGGAEAVLLRLHDGFVKRGFESQIVTLKPQNDYFSTSVSTTCLHLKKSALTTPAKIALFLKHAQPDMVLVHICDLHRVFSTIEYPNIFFVVHLELSYKLHTKNNFFSRYRFRRRIERTYQKHRTITVSHAIKKDMLSHFNLDETKIEVIYNPFDLEKIVRKSLEPLHTDEAFLLYIGRLVPIKRVDILLKAFAKIKNKTIKLVLLGEGPLKGELQKLASELHITERLIFPGWQPNPFRYIKKAKLVLLSSESESLSNVLVESLMLHTPVVSTKTAGAQEIMTDALQPYLAAVNDIDDLASKIDLAMQTYPEIRHTCYEKFHADRIVQQYIDLLS